MSVVLKRHIEARIERLEARLASQDAESLQTEIKELTGARNVVSSKRMRTSLDKEIGKLKLSVTELDAKPIQDELETWKPVMEFINVHSDYNRTRKSKK